MSSNTIANYHRSMSQYSRAQAAFDSRQPPEYYDVDCVTEEEMDEYEVTIPFTQAMCGWYTGYCKAGSAREAVKIIKQQAAMQGWNGPHKKVIVEAVK